MKKLIHVYVKDKTATEFLTGYFKNIKKYKVEFFSNITKLKKALKDNPPRILIVEVPECLDRLKLEANRPAVLAIAAGNITYGMRSMIDNKVEHYLAPPFQTYDIEYKLEILLSRSSYVDLLTQELDDLRTITQLTDFLSTTLDPQEILNIIVKKISENIPVSRCSILSVSFEGEDNAEVVSTFEGIKNKIILDLKKYPEITKALKTRRSVVVWDAQNDPLMKPVKKLIKGMGIKSIAVVPIIFRSEIIGTLFLRTSRKKYEFSDREIRLFQEIANAAGNALNNAFLFRQLEKQSSDFEQLAITDYLTGIYNIRYLYHRIETEFSRSIRHGTTLSCLMLDIDHFKRINDTYGHRTGDVVLRDFANLIQSHTRKSDVFARYGGEEFVMLLPDSDENGAFSKARFIKNAVEEHKFKGLNQKTSITISIGIATCPNKMIKAQDDLIRMADNALLKAKSAGRNRIMIFK